MEKIYVHSFSEYGSRNLELPIFDRLLHENKLYPITTNEGVTHWFFKLNKK